MTEAIGRSERSHYAFAGAWVLLAVLVAYTLTRAPASDDVPNLLQQLVYLLPFVLAVFAATIAAVRAPHGDDKHFWLALAAVTWFVGAIEVSYSYSIFAGQQLEAVQGVWAFILAGIPAVIFAYLLASLSRATAAALPARLHYFSTGLIATILLFLMTYGMLVKPLLDQLGLTNHVVQAQVSFRTAIGIGVLLATFLNVGALKANAWRRWEVLTIGGVAVYAVGLGLEPLVFASEFGWPNYGEQIAEALWMIGMFMIFLGAVSYLRDGVHGVPVRRSIPASLLAGGWTAVVFDSLTLVSAMGILAASFRADSVFEQRMYVAGSVALVVLFLSREVFGSISSGRLLSSAVVDSPTKLYTARHFSESLESEVDVAVRTGEPLSVAVINLDDLELMDTVEGFGSSDRVILAAATAIRSMATQGLYAARLGWDQFGLLLPEVPASVAQSRVDRVLAAILAATGVTASAGIATFPTHTVDAGELKRFAEGALYHAKEHGKNRSVVYDPAVVRHMTPDERIASLERQNHLGAVRALAAAVDQREAGTRHHSQHVAELAVTVGRALGMTEDELHALDLAALLHDVGYIGVPERILRKPGPLNASERAHVEEHAILGARIIDGTGAKVALPAIRGHHERWDGSGYPDGLAGEDIPLAARILAVCDAYDAMTNDRPHRHAFTRYAALQEIDLNMGTQFDPRVAEAFIRLLGADERSPSLEMLLARQRDEVV